MLCFIPVCRERKGLEPTIRDRITIYLGKNHFTRTFEFGMRNRRATCGKGSWNFIDEMYSRIAPVYRTLTSQGLLRKDKLPIQTRTIPSHLEVLPMTPVASLPRYSIVLMSSFFFLLSSLGIPLCPPQFFCTIVVRGGLGKYPSTVQPRRSIFGMNVPKHPHCIQLVMNRAGLLSSIPTLHSGILHKYPHFLPSSFP
jgi:hypothetical protein